MSFNLPGDLSRRCFHKTQVIVFDTVELIGLNDTIDVDSRVAYVSRLIEQIEYPVHDLPWNKKITAPLVFAPGQLLGAVEDITLFYFELREALVSMSYKGEQLIVSASKGTHVLIYYFKE